jgi:putative N6-adenine-specific DNA methylase
VTAPGIAPLTAGELRRLGVPRTAVGPEGVSFRASLAVVGAANLWLRTATRVLVRAASFRADAFYDLERRAARVPWSRFIAPGTRVRLRVTCRKSRLYHSDAVAERFAPAVERAGGVVIAASGVRSADGDDGPGSDLPADSVTGDAAGGPTQLVVVRLYHDECTVSVDASGELLHRRGYRQETAKAPLRETLAAALLMASGWDGRAPLIDPMCGSGTVAIEGAWIARDRAPGLGRDFAFMQWPEFDRGEWEGTVADARSRVRVRSPVPIRASDRDAGAIGAATRNAERADVSQDVEFVTRAISAITPPAQRGWLVTNPPYGVRVSDRGRLRDLYGQLGHVARAKCPGWTVALLSANQALTNATRLGLTTRLHTTNGGIRVAIVSGKVGK